MLRWCSHCQKYLGEKAPFVDYTLTHTVCPDCTLLLDADLSVPERARELSVFYQDLLRASLDGTLPPVSDVLRRTREIEIRPIDILMGLIQPILYQIGDCWAERRLSVAGEHAATEFFSVMMELLRAADPGRKLVKSAKPEVLLVNADGNYHTLGSMVVEAYLTLHGRTSFRVAPGLPVPEIIDLCNEFEPYVLGVSISMQDHLDTLRHLNRWLDGRPGPVGVAGGSFFRSHPEIDLMHFQRASGPEDLLPFLKPEGTADSPFM